MLGRRPFLIGCGSLVAAPAVLAQLAPPATGIPPSVLPVGAALPAAADEAAAPQDLVLRIHGWDVPEASDRAARNEAWIHISASWRAAWH